MVKKAKGSKTGQSQRAEESDSSVSSELSNVESRPPRTRREARRTRQIAPIEESVEEPTTSTAAVPEESQGPVKRPRRDSSQNELHTPEKKRASSSEKIFKPLVPSAPSETPKRGRGRPPKSSYPPSSSSSTESNASEVIGSPISEGPRREETVQLVSVGSQTDELGQWVVTEPVVNENSADPVVNENTADPVDNEVTTVSVAVVDPNDVESETATTETDTDEEISEAPNSEDEDETEEEGAGCVII